MASYPDYSQRRDPPVNAQQWIARQASGEVETSQETFPPSLVTVADPPARFRALARRIRIRGHVAAVRDGRSAPTLPRRVRTLRGPGPASGPDHGCEAGRGSRGLDSQEQRVSV